MYALYYRPPFPPDADATTEFISSLIVAEARARHLRAQGFTVALYTIANETTPDPEPTAYTFERKH